MIAFVIIRRTDNCLLVVRKTDLPTLSAEAWARQYGYVDLPESEAEMWQEEIINGKMPPEHWAVIQEMSRPLYPDIKLIPGDEWKTEQEKCEGCGEPATTHDITGVPLCAECAALPNE